jgi:hypothetical protein
VNAGTKVGGFLAGLVVVGAVGAGVGSLAGPIDTGADDAAHGDEHTETESPTHEAEGHEAEAPASEDGHEGHDAEGGAETAAVGTAATQDGYRLVLDPTEDEIRFEVLDPEGEPVVDTEVLHERPLHLIVVGRDLVGYAHVHPTVDADGTWSVERPDLAPGSYRVVADLQPTDGPELVLAADLAVPGTAGPVDVPEPATTATVDGITVTMGGHVEVGDTELSFSVDGGEPEPYLGARGHLVAFRTDDLAYTHVHPHDGTEGPVRFTASFATPGTYRLFLDLQVDGVVRTFPFTVEVHGHEH